MFALIWHTIFFNPVYNSLVFFIDTVPGGDVGVAIILTTLLVKAILLPVSFKAARTQLAMKEIEPEMKRIKEKFKEKRDEQAQAMMALYKKAGVNPFSSVVLLLIQIPIIIALYFSVASRGNVPLPEINTAILYSFVPVPHTVSMVFLNIINIADRSLPLAALAGITQFVQTRLTLPKQEPRDPNKATDFKEDFARSMQLQMRYAMPIIIFFVAYAVSAAIALYFFVSNLAAVLQELAVRKKGYRATPENTGTKNKSTN
jgi:YidC/Oxa1 family membrane protein insertase